MIASPQNPIVKSAPPGAEILCSCNNFTAADLEQFMGRRNGIDFEAFLAATGVGNKCAACLLDVEYRFCELTLQHGSSDASALAAYGKGTRRENLSLKQRLYRLVDALSPTANLGRTFDAIIPVVRGDGIEQFIWIANRSRMFSGTVCGPPLRVRIVVRAGDGRLISDNNYNLGRDHQLRVNVSDRLEMPAQSNQVTIGAARIEWHFARPGKKGTTRAQFEIVAKRSSCSVHSLTAGMQPETWLTLMWRPGEERLLFPLVNGEARPIDVEFYYPFPVGGADGVLASSHVVTVPGRGASLYELRLDPETSDRLRDKSFAVRYRCNARYKPFMIVASPSLDRLSIDHV